MRKALEQLPMILEISTLWYTETYLEIIRVAYIASGRIHKICMYDVDNFQCLLHHKEKKEKENEVFFLRNFCQDT